MIEITSKNNETYKLFQKLKTKKYRDRMGLYLIEGENLMEEALKNGADIKGILIRKDDESRWAKRGFNQKKIFAVENSLFNDVAQTETSQGIIAVVEKPVFSLEDFIESGAPGNFVILDRLQDPGNIGTIIRTADAAGYGLIIAMKGTADFFSPKVVRAAAGSMFRMPMISLADEGELLKLVQAAGKHLTATCLEESRYYYEEDLSRDIALIIGNEGNGISQDLMNRAEIKVKIPMTGNIESLNASVAAAIIMYEAVRGAATGRNIESKEI